MDTHEAASKIRALMDEFNLHDWDLVWITAKRMLGVCRYTRMEIGINREYTAMSEWNEIEQVALHEIAHALTPGMKHNPTWQKMAFAIGVKDPASCVETAPLPGRYQAICELCGTVHYRYKRAKNMNRTACGRCCKIHNGGKYDERFALTYVDTYVAERTIASEPKTSSERTESMSESTILSATELAVRVGTDPKTLRRFLRENDSFRNPGSGKRYSFSAREAESVEKAFRSWDSKRSRRTQTSGDARPKDKSTRSAAERQKRAQDRVDALEESLRSRGVHIDQHR